MQHVLIMSPLTIPTRRNLPSPPPTKYEWHKPSVHRGLQQMTHRVRDYFTSEKADGSSRIRVGIGSASLGMHRVTEWHHTRQREVQSKAPKTRSSSPLEVLSQQTVSASSSSSPPKTDEGLYPLVAASSTKVVHPLSRHRASQRFDLYTLNLFASEAQRPFLQPNEDV